MHAPLAGRRIWFVGIGGAGLSGYALLAAAWGAEVGAGTRSRRRTCRTSAPPGSAWSSRPSRSPRLRDGRRSSRRLLRVHGTDARGVPRRARRAAALDRRRGRARQDDDRGDDRVRPRPAGARPVVPDRRRGSQLGGNARAGSGWLVVEGDESDRTVAALRPEIAVVTNVDLDHHTEFASRADVAVLFEEWLAEVPQVVRGESLLPAEFP